VSKHRCGTDRLSRRRVRFRRPSIRSRFAWSFLLAAVVVSGCVGDTDGGGPEQGSRDVESSPPADRELLARVSAVVRAWPTLPGRDDAFAYADLRRARDQLGLPRNSDILGGGRRRLLLSLALRPLFRFLTAVVGEPSLGPLGHVLDTRRIDVAVGTSFAFSGPGSEEVWPWDVAVLRIRQPFREIADRLRREGYEDTRDGLLVTDRPPPRQLSLYPHKVPFPAAGDAGGGVVVFGGSRSAVRAALQGAGAELTPTVALLGQLPGVGRVATGAAGWGPSASAPCVVAIGLGEDAAPREGQIVVLVDGKAEARRLLWGGSTYFAMSANAEVVFGPATAAGNRASVRFRSTDAFNPTRLGVENVGAPYECPQRPGAESAG
jgi:hypothetical protein